MGPPSDQFLRLLYWAPSGQFLRLLYGAPLIFFHFLCVKLSLGGPHIFEFPGGAIKCLLLPPLPRAPMGRNIAQDVCHPSTFLAMHTGTRKWSGLRGLQTPPPPILKELFFIDHICYYVQLISIGRGGLYMYISIHRISKMWTFYSVKIL